MKVLITGSSKFPVPAVRGGAVPNLIEEIIQQQEIENKLELDCCALWDKEAEIVSHKYKNTNFIWAKKPGYIGVIDCSITWVLKNIFHVKRLHSIGFLFQVIWLSFYIGKVLKKNDYDRVIFENSVPMIFALKLYRNKKKYDGKYYIHMHSVPRKYYGNEKEFSNCKGLISISKYVANEICADERVSISDDQVKLMYNCIDTERICPKNNKELLEYLDKYGISKDKKVILFAGRLCKDKGIEEVIECVKRLNNKNYVLVIVGANFYNSGIVSPYEEHLRGITEEIQDQIVFTGYIDYNKMSYIYNMADVVVLPSMWEEPAGMTIIEAMACRKPVVTTISGGIPEYTEDGNCILLERNESLIDNMKSSVERILSDEKYAEKIAGKGYLQAIKFNKEFYYKQLIEILKEE
jgi:hypothetical protein